MALSSFEAMPHRELSRSVEDYLKAIFRLSTDGEPASTTAIAEALDIQPASVTGMVKRLAETGLLRHVPYRGARLTDAGEQAALKVLRRHRIIETYLCQMLEYAWDDVHAEAERLEHAASDELVERMAACVSEGFAPVERLAAFKFLDRQTTLGRIADHAEEQGHGCKVVDGDVVTQVDRIRPQ